MLNWHTFKTFLLLLLKFFKNHNNIQYESDKCQPFKIKMITNTITKVKGDNHENRNKRMINNNNKIKVTVTTKKNQQKKNRTTIKYDNNKWKIEKRQW